MCHGKIFVSVLNSPKSCVTAILQSRPRVVVIARMRKSVLMRASLIVNVMLFVKLLASQRLQHVTGVPTSNRVSLFAKTAIALA